MKIEIVQRGKDFFVRTKWFFILYKYYLNSGSWWNIHVNPDPRFYGTSSIEDARSLVTGYKKRLQAEKAYKEKMKIRREEERKNKKQPFMIKEIIDV